MKRGQITTFAIIGIVIVAAVILVMYMRGQFFFGPVTPENLGTKLDSIEEHIENCIEETSPEYIERIAMQGGHLSTPEGTFRMRDDIPISYLCYNIPDQKTCSNRLLLLTDMEEELASAIDTSLNSCINLNQFGRGFELTSGRRETSVSIGEQNVNVQVRLPIAVTKGDVKLNEEMFSVTFDYPLGRLYDVGQDIINVEAEFGEFDQLGYMLDKKGQILIEKDRPYPDKIYMLTQRNSDYKFQFFVQGEPN